MLQDLLCITGSIDTNRGDVQGYNGFENALLSAKQHNLEHEVLTGDEVNARFPGYNLPSNFMVHLCYASLLHCSSLSGRLHAPLMQSVLLCLNQPSEAVSELLLYTNQLPLTAQALKRECAVSYTLYTQTTSSAQACFLTDDRVLPAGSISATRWNSGIRAMHCCAHTSCTITWR